MSLRAVLVLTVVCCGITAAAVRYLYPRVELKHEIVEKEVVRKDIVTVVKEVVKPDGSKETTSTTTDRSTEKRDTRELLIIAKEPQWLVGAGASASIADKVPVYEILVARRVLGPAFIGGKVQFDSEVKFGVFALAEF